MGTQNSTDKIIHELTESLRKSDDTINKLTEALERSERRYQSIERYFRWMGVIVLGFGMVMIS